MAVYQADTLSERPIYGSSRLGNLSYASKPGYRTVGHKQYELSNHLGNVLAVVSDRIRMRTDSTWTQVLSRTDYYPFGLEMTGRTESMSYRYGFNGKEKDPSGQWSNQSHYDYGFRIYNPTIGKFLSVDPLTADYPWYTPYQFAGNKPIWAIDLDGLEELFYKDAFRKSEIGETVINRANNTTLFKEFESKLKSQNKINVYVVNFDSKISYYDGGYKDINISFEGHPQGESVTKGTVQFTRNRDEFNRLVSKDYAFRSAAKGIDEGLLNRTFDSGKGMLFIMVANPLIYPGSYSNSNKKDHNIFLKNAIRNSVNTYVHESWDHGLHYLLDPNYKNDFEKTLIDHFNYHGVKTLDSPSVEDFDKDPKKYRGTKFEKTIKEIDGKD